MNSSLMSTRYLCLLIFLFISNHSSGHGEQHYDANMSVSKSEDGMSHHATSQPSANRKGVGLFAGIATTYRSDDGTDQSIWQLPGLLMGGDAAAPEQGLSLDDAYLSLSWTDQEAISALFELGQHGDHELQLEQAFFSYAHQFAIPLNAEFSAGRLKGAFSPENSSHASGRPFSDNNLLYDAFFGAHYADEGVRLELSSGNAEGLTLGTEVWRGASFPATSGSGGGAQDLYLHWQGETGPVQWKTGIWGFLARAEERGDDRFDDGHNHGNDVEDNNIDFDGTQRMAGIFASILWQPRAEGDIRLQGEFVNVDVQGDISDPTRQAELEGSYQGYSLQPEIRFNRHYLTLRYTRLIVDNHITGAGGESLAADAGLHDMGRDPSMTGVSYRYRFNNGIGMRLEWTDNRTTGADNDYFGVGVFWRAALY